MLLIVLSHEEFFKEENKMVTQLLRNHPFIFHLRKPNATKNDYETFIKDIPEEFHHHIILHDYYELLDKYRLKGLHFSTKNRKYSSLYPTAYKSTSCHTLREIEELDGEFDSLFISPIFPSISKKGYSGNLDMNRLKNYLNTNRKSKVIALGGIDKSKLQHISSWGFDGAALLGAIWGNHPPMPHFEEQLSEIVTTTQLYNSL